MKILCLGNEFIKEDSFAKEIAKELANEMNEFEFVFIKDSFQLISELNKNNGEIVILDVAEGLKEVKFLNIEDLSDNKIITAHDLDAQFILKLFEDKKIKIIGIPMSGDVNIIKKNVKILIE